MIYRIGTNRLAPVDCSKTSNLPIGTVLKLEGYSNPEYVIVGQIDTSYGVIYETVNPETLAFSRHKAYCLKWIEDKAHNGIQTYITHEIRPEDEVKRLLGMANDLRQFQEELKARQKQEIEESIARGEVLFAQRPTWAKAVIAACLESDESDIMTDYFATREGKPILLAWSKHNRDLFPEMRQAAISSKMPELQHFAENKPEDEHREKWSMGAGFYLKRGSRYSTAWKVYKETISEREICLALGEGRSKL